MSVPAQPNATSAVRSGMQIAEVAPGKLLSRGKANKLIRFVNALLRLQIVNGFRNKLTISDLNAVLELNTGGNPTDAAAASNSNFKGEWASATVMNYADIAFTHDFGELPVSFGAGATLGDFSRYSFWVWVGADGTEAGTEAQPNYYDLIASGGISSASGNWVLISSYSYPANYQSPFAGDTPWTGSIQVRDAAGTGVATLNFLGGLFVGLS